jgi:hypothetical protein
MQPRAGSVGFGAVAAPSLTDARRTLLAGLIDHAALFPPASMSVEDALAEDRRLRASRHGWIVGRFVVPASRLAELGNAELRLTVVLDSPPTDDSRIEAVEARPGVNLEGLVGLADEVYAEISLADADPMPILERVAGLGLRAKFRCGPVAPSARTLGAAIAACRELGIPFKATAGLHHALPTDGEHGFLNLLAAAVFGRQEAALATRELELTETGFAWGTKVASADELAVARRDRFVGFGSCSVAEPIDELTELGVLPA